MTPVKIQKAESLDYLKALIFGPSGSGKTHFIGSAERDPRTAPLIVLDFEGGSRTLQGTGVDIIRITSWDDYNEAFDMLANQDHGYKTVAIDSISETNTFALFQILEEEKGSRENPDLIEIADYGIASVQLRRLIRSFRDLPMNVIISALPREDTEPRIGTVLKPLLTGRLANEIPGIVDVVGYLAQEDTDEGIHRVLILQNYPHFRTKVRMPSGVEAPDEIEDPTITKLLDAVTLGKPSKKSNRKKKKRK